MANTVVRKIQIDLNTMVCTFALGERSPIQELPWKIRDSARFGIRFHRAGVPELLPTGSTIILGCKDTNDFGGGFLFQANSWTAATSVDPLDDSDAAFYNSLISLNTTELDAYLDDSTARKDAMCEVEVNIGGTGSRQSTATISAPIYNDVVRGDEGQPTPGDPTYPQPSEIIIFKGDIDSLEGGQPNDLDALPTVDINDLPYTIAFVNKDGGAGNERYQNWILEASTEAGNGSSLIRPLDFADPANAKVWHLYPQATVSTADVTAPASATNYTPTGATTQGHLDGIDAELANQGIPDVEADPAPTLGGPLITKDNDIVLTEADGTTIRGALVTTTAGNAALVRTAPDGTHDESDGAVEALQGGIRLYGARATVDGLTGTGYREVWVDDSGDLLAVTPADPGQEANDTDAGTYDLGTGTGQGTAVEMTGLAVTVASDVAAGSQIILAANVYAANKTNNRTGVISLGFGLNGAEPTTWHPFDIAAGQAGVIPLSAEGNTISLSASDVITVWGRRESGNNAAFGVDLDGTVETHTFYFRASTGGGGGTADNYDTIQIPAQSFVADDGTPTLVEQSYGGAPRNVWRMPDLSNQSIQAALKVQSNWDVTAPIKMRVTWSHIAGTGDVRFVLGSADLGSPGGAFTSSTAASETITSASGGANFQNMTSAATIADANDFAVGDMFAPYIFRQGADGADTLAENCDIIAVEIQVKTLTGTAWT